MNAVVVVKDLVKLREAVRAVDGISFEVNAGEIFGLIGPDGAGKTTLFRVLTSLLTPDSGSATVLGLDVKRDLWKLRPKLGYMPGRFSLYPDLTALENLTFYASVFGTSISAQQEMIKPIWDQLKEFGSRRAGALSGGMKQKLALCCALVHRPELLFLDEPTTGVDAVSRKEFWDLLATLKSTGLTIVVSTPYMDEAIRCDRVGLMQQGKLLSVNPPNAISEAYPLPLFSVQAKERKKLLDALRQFPHAAEVWSFGQLVHYSDKRADVSPEQIQQEVKDWAMKENLTDFHIEPIAAGVEDAFIHLMSHSAA